MFTEPPGSPSADGPCHCSQCPVWFLLKLAHGDQQGQQDQQGLGRTEAYHWIKKPWCGRLVSLRLSYCLHEL